MSEMKKTTIAYCKGCVYNMTISSTVIACDYMHMTGQRRGCPVGYCDKKEPKTTRKSWTTPAVKRRETP